MKKIYEKPMAAVENFMLDQFIAGSCSVKTNYSDACWEANKTDWYSKLSTFDKIQIDYGQFTAGVCSIDADQPTDDPNDTLCYHTQGSPLFQS